MSSDVRVRNLREGEAAGLPPALRGHGLPYLVPEWAWVVETPDHTTFALIVGSFAHGYLVLFRVLAISPLPPGTPLTWFMEALPQVFSEARARGCVGFVTLLADNRPREVKLARIISRMAGAAIMPFQGSVGVGLFDLNSEGAE